MPFKKYASTLFFANLYRYNCSSFITSINQSKPSVIPSPLIALDATIDQLLSFNSTRFSSLETSLALNAPGWSCLFAKPAVLHLAILLPVTSNEVP